MFDIYDFCIKLNGTIRFLFLYYLLNLEKFIIIMSKYGYDIFKFFDIKLALFSFSLIHITFIKIPLHTSSRKPFCHIKNYCTFIAKKSSNISLILSKHYITVFESISVELKVMDGHTLIFPFSQHSGVSAVKSAYTHGLSQILEKADN